MLMERFGLQLVEVYIILVQTRFGEDWRSLPNIDGRYHAQESHMGANKHSLGVDQSVSVSTGLPTESTGSVTTSIMYP